MNNRFISGIIILLALLLLHTGCHKNPPEPTPPEVKAKLRIVSGNYQSGGAGQPLSDSLVMAIMDNDTIPFSNFYVQAKIAAGNGTISNLGWTNGPLHPDAQNGKVRAAWNLGCIAGAQTATFYLYQCGRDSNNLMTCAAIDSVRFEATATTPHGWAKACGVDYGGQFVTMQNNGIIYYISNGAVYFSTDGVYWNELKTIPSGVQAYDLKFNSKGTMYLLTKDHGIYYSVNNGATWQAINNGIIDHRYPLTFVVEDTALFVSFYFDGLYRTTNNGSYWKKLLVDGKYYEEYSNLTRHRDGSLYLNDKWSSVFRSTDNGDNWQRVSISYQYVRSPLSDIETNPAGNLIIASSYDGLLTELSPQTLSGSLVSYYEPETHSTCLVHDLRWQQNQLYFLVAGNTKPGLYAGNNGGYQHLYPEFPMPIQSYFVKKDGTILLAAENGVYYYNQ